MTRGSVLIFFLAQASGLRLSQLPPEGANLYVKPHKGKSAQTPKSAESINSGVVEQPGQRSHDIVVIRTHNPTEAMRNRIKMYAKEVIKKTTQSNITLVISVDMTDSPEQGTKLLKDLEKYREMDNIKIHSFVWEDVLKGFPTLSNNQTEYQWLKYPEWFGRTSKSLSFEPSYLAVQEAMQGDHGKPFPCTGECNLRVWMIEDDVLLCNGGLSNLVEAYKDNNADMLAPKFEDVSTFDQTLFKTDFHWDSITPIFAKRYDENQRWKTFLFVSRLSMNLFNKIAELSQEGVAGYPEVVGATVCMAEHFVCKHFDHKHTPGPYFGIGWHDSPTLTKKHAAKKTCNENKDLMTINHPAKY